MVSQTSIKPRTNDEMVVWYLPGFHQSRDSPIIVSIPQVHQATKP
jgi:hypothetical protein